MKKTKGKLPLISNEEGEKVEAIICLPTRLGPPEFPGTIDICSKCGEQVHRSHSAPKAPVAVCLDCAIIQIKAEAEKDEEVTIAVTENQLGELLMKVEPEKLH